MELESPGWEGDGKVRVAGSEYAAPAMLAAESVDPGGVSFTGVLDYVTRMIGTSSGMS